MSVQNVIIKQQRKVHFIHTENQSMKAISSHVHNVDQNSFRKKAFRLT